MTNKKEILLAKATELFMQGGYTAIGVDRIVAEAGVAKMTLYKYFPSKADLILAVLVQRDHAFRTSLMAAADKETTFTNKIHALFIWHDQWFRRKDFNGCMFINAAAEYHDRKSPIHKMSAQHKQLIVDYIESILSASHGKRAGKLAVQINMLLDGAIDAAHVMSHMRAAIDAWEAAQRLIAVD